MDESHDNSSNIPDENLEDNEQKEITKLLTIVPILNNLFKIHYKVGEGTFSSVFLATLKNSIEDRQFAVKHLVPTCHPERIERELQCLQEIGGKDHVVGLELCLRNAGSVVFVMPFMRHDKFCEYVQDMSTDEMRDYMKALLLALYRVHKYNIIHRDIKPSNFLYDRSNKRYLLVDFGLAQQYTPINKLPSPKESNQQTQKRKFNEDDNNERDQKKINKQCINKCYCFGKPRVCTLCITRPPQNAPRAGTPGYRAPEVLLKYSHQTPAIDIWACGVIMLCILSGAQPFFKAPDDLTALAEITTIFGSDAMQKYAKKLGKKLVFSTNETKKDLAILCQKLKNRNRRYHNDDPNYLQEESKQLYPNEAYQLLAKLLDIDHKTRITAEQALLHPFFQMKNAL